MEGFRDRKGSGKGPVFRTSGVGPERVTKEEGNGWTEWVDEGGQSRRTVRRYEGRTRRVYGEESRSRTGPKVREQRGRRTSGRNKFRDLYDEETEDQDLTFQKT